MNIKAWMSAFRLRTLPLALASIMMGSFLAGNGFRLEILGLSALTAILLQILSNLANDYGDSVHGADSSEREGPSRAVQTGAITATQMRIAIAIFVLLSLASGLSLLWVSGTVNFLFFFVLGIFSIIAAMAYTMGSRPYGYAGLGDISVMLFFGIVGTCGTYYLHTGIWDNLMLLPALSCGFFSTAVLNINNIRDIESDKKAGKLSIPVRLGRARASWYHLFLLLGGVLGALIYTVLRYEHLTQWAFLIASPLLFLNAKAIFTKKTPMEIDPYLRQMALTTLLFVLSFGLGLL